MDYLLDIIWNYKISLIPVASAYLVFEISSIIRRLLRIAYTPIYFMFFPLGHADSLYAQYFNEDYFYGVGETQTEIQKNRLRKRIISISAASMLFSAVINPAIAGIFSAIFLTAEQFSEFFWILCLSKLLLVSYSLYQSRNASFVTTSRSLPWLSMIYFAYFIVVMRVLQTSQQWAVDKIAASNVTSMLTKIVDLVIFDFGIFVLFSAIIGAAVSYWMTDPDNIRAVTELHSGNEHAE